MSAKLKRVVPGLVVVLLAAAFAPGLAQPAGDPAQPADAEAQAGENPAPKPKGKSVKFERLPNGDLRLGGITVHPKERRISFEATINQAGGPLEVLIATPEGRLHEALLCASVSPLHLQTLLYLLNLRNGPRCRSEAGKQGDLVDIDLEWRNQDGKLVCEPIEQWVCDVRTNKPMTRMGWVFTGSSIVEGAFQAEVGGNIVLVFTGADTILDLPDKAGEDDTIFVANDGKTDPGKGAKVRVILAPRKAKR